MRILRKSCRFLKMLQNEPLIAKFGVDTAEKCTIENLQIEGPLGGSGGRRKGSQEGSRGGKSEACSG